MEVCQLTPFSNVSSLIRSNARSIRRTHKEAILLMAVWLPWHRLLALLIPRSSLTAADAERCKGREEPLQHARVAAGQLVLFLMFRQSDPCCLSPF